MILTVRKYFHKGLLQGLVWVMILSLIGIGSLGQMVSMFFSDGRSIFSVNGQGVNEKVFALRVNTEKRILDFYKEQLGDLAPRFLAQMGMDMSPEKNAYNKIVQELALISSVKRSGLQIGVGSLVRKAQDPMAVMNIFGATLPRSLYDRNGKLQKDILVRILGSIGLNLEDFEMLLEQAAQKDLALDLIKLSVPVTDKEMEVGALKEYGVRTYKIDFYGIAEYLKQAKKEEVSVEALKEFFDEQNERAARYWAAEKRNGIVWKLPTTAQNQEKLAQEAQEVIKGSEELFNRFIERNKGQKSLLKNKEQKQDSQQSLMLFKLTEGNKGLYQDKNEIVIVMPTEIFPATQNDYHLVEAQVKNDYFKAKAQKAIIEDLEGAGISDAHKTDSLKVTIRPGTTQAELDTLVKKSLSVDRMKNMVMEGSHLKGVRDEGAYVVTLESLERPQAISLEQKMKLRADISKENERIVMAASVDSLLKNAKIKNNKAL